MTGQNLIEAAKRGNIVTVSTIKSFNRQFGVTKGECEIVKQAWEQEPTYTCGV